MKRAVLSLVLILFVFGSVVAIASINNVEFFLQSNLTQQTILLVENISTPLVIVESRPSQNYFSLIHDITHNLVYLTLAYITPMFCQHLPSLHYSLVLSNQMEFNVTLFINANKCLLSSNLITIEYMFKYDEEESGAIKSSMLGNSVVAILKTTLNVDELVLVNRTELFHLKKFLPKFYMLRLSQNASILFEDMLVNDEVIWLKVLCRNQSQHEIETLLK